ncbi:MAG: hypothetical protein WA040_11635, partial [Anaerolineae bacterium]
MQHTFQAGQGPQLKPGTARRIVMKSKWMTVVLCLTLAVGLFAVWPVAAAPDVLLAAIVLTGSTYTQDFDTLANSSTSSATPTGWAFSETGANANTTYTAGTGSSSTGDTYSFGSDSAVERAFGGLRSGSLVPIIGAEFTNGTGVTITSIGIAFNCEQWRIGFANRNAADRLDFQYSTNATSLTTGNWVDVDDLDCLSTNTADSVGAKDGNNSQYRTAVSAIVAGLNFANGATFWLRWTDYDISNADDGLGIDDFRLDPANPTAITLAEFSAAQQGDAVQVSWETVSELDNAGFNLYRSESAAGPQTLLTYLPASSPGGTAGAAYAYEDRAGLTPGQSYYYWLEDVAISGATTLHGPVSVDFTAPTAVTLDGVAASPAAALPAVSWL